MDEIITEMTLQNSSIFQKSNPNGEVYRLLQDVIKTGNVLDESYVEEQILWIKKSKVNWITEAVIKSFTSGKVKLIEAKNKKVSQLFPFIVTKSSNGPVAIIFTNNYGTVTTNSDTAGGNSFNITPKDLYALLEGAYVALCYIDNPGKFTKNIALMKLSCEVYTSMILRILNKEYALSMDPIQFGKASFCISRFFFDKVWEYTNPDVSIRYAQYMIRNDVNIVDITNLSDDYDSAHIIDIYGLINFLKEQIPRMANFSVSYLVQWYMNLYKPASVLGIEVLPYFLFTINTTLIGSPLVNYNIIGDIMKNIRGIKNFSPELIRCCS